MVAPKVQKPLILKRSCNWRQWVSQQWFRMGEDQWWARINDGLGSMMGKDQWWARENTCSLAEGLSSLCYSRFQLQENWSWISQQSNDVGGRVEVDKRKISKLNVLVWVLQKNRTNRIEIEIETKIGICKEISLRNWLMRMWKLRSPKICS